MAPGQTSSMLSLVPENHGPTHVVQMAGTILAACAGFINVATFVLFGGFVGHVSGTASKIGMISSDYVSTGGSADLVPLWEAAGCWFAFINGAFICGLLISKNEIRFGRSLYGTALVLEGTLLLLTTLHYGDKKFPAMYIAACACGLQNGMCTMHFGAVVRTTHLTGLSTDLGTALGRIVKALLKNGRGQWSNLDASQQKEVSEDIWKVNMWLRLASGFVVGAFCGGSVANAFGAMALAVPAFVTGTGGLMYMIFQERLTVQTTRVLQKFSRSGSFCSSVELPPYGANQTALLNV